MKNDPDMSVEHVLGSTVLAAGAGQHFEFLNHLATIKLEGQGRTMSVAEFLAPQGFGPPEHRHNDEDELFFVLDGEVRFLTGGEEAMAGTGGFAHLPHGESHTFQVLSPTARFVTVTASIAGEPRFDQMVSSLGSPITMPTLPEPGYIDPARIAQVCASFGIDIVGPPPGEGEAR